MAYQTTKKRERTVVMMNTENRTRIITTLQLPSSSCMGSEWEAKGSKRQGRSAKQAAFLSKVNATQEKNTGENLESDVGTDRQMV